MIGYVILPSSITYIVSSNVEHNQTKWFAYFKNSDVNWRIKIFKNKKELRLMN
jgi:hypothetical protein